MIRLDRNTFAAQFRRSRLAVRSRDGRRAAKVLRGRRPCLESLESRRLLATIVEFDVPTPGSYPWDITAGPEGDVWFVELMTNDQFKIGMIDPMTRVISDFSVAGPTPVSLTSGPDGNLWATFDNNTIGTINPTTHAVTEFPVPTASSFPNEITTGPDGNLWFTESVGNKIGMINPTTDAIAEFPVPTANSYPSAITAGPDGNLWFTEELSDQIGMINPTTHTITEFPIPTLGSQPSPNDSGPSASDPSSITAGPDGNVWFGERSGNAIGMINPTTHAITAFPTPTSGSSPFGITAGPDGNLWFSEILGNQIGMINPVTHAIAEYPTPTAISQPASITTGPDGNIWFTEPDIGKIGVLTPSINTNLQISTQPPASVTPGTPFGVTVTVDFLSGTVDSGFNGPVSLALADNPGGASLGGTLTVTAKDGVASFDNLTLDQLGTGYRIMAFSDTQTVALTAFLTVAIPTAIDVPPPIIVPRSSSIPTISTPTIVAEQALLVGKGRHEHVAGFVLDFNMALDPASAQDVANYSVSRTVMDHGKLMARRVRIRAAYDPSAKTVLLTFGGRLAFARGGLIVVNAASPSGIADTGGTFLDGTDRGEPGVNVVFAISPRASAITRK